MRVATTECGRFCFPQEKTPAAVQGMFKLKVSAVTIGQDDPIPREKQLRKLIATRPYDFGVLPRMMS